MYLKNNLNSIILEMNFESFEFFEINEKIYYETILCRNLKDPHKLTYK